MKTIKYHEGMWVISPDKELGTLIREIPGGFNFLPIWATRTHTTYVSMIDIDGYRPVTIQKGDWILYNCEKYRVMNVTLSNNTVVFKLVTEIGSVHSFVNYKEVMLNYEILKYGYGH